MSAPPAEQIREIRRWARDDPEELQTSTLMLLAALDYVAARLAEHEQSKPQTSYGVHRELIAYIGSASQ